MSLDVETQRQHAIESQVLEELKWPVNKIAISSVKELEEALYAHRKTQREKVPAKPEPIYILEGFGPNTHHSTTPQPITPTLWQITPTHNTPQSSRSFSSSSSSSSSSATIHEDSTTVQENFSESTPQPSTTFRETLIIHVDDPITETRPLISKEVTSKTDNVKVTCEEQVQVRDVKQETGGEERKTETTISCYPSSMLIYQPWFQEQLSVLQVLTAKRNQYDSIIALSDPADRNEMILLQDKFTAINTQLHTCLREILQAKKQLEQKILRDKFLERDVTAATQCLALVAHIE